MEKCKKAKRMDEIKNNEKTENNQTDMFTSENGKMLDSINNVYVFGCKKEDGKDYIITGLTSDGTKAVYNTITNKWYYGKNICQAYLIPMQYRPLEERQAIGRQGIKKVQECKERKKNLQELAKALLDKKASDSMIKKILGEDTEMLEGETLGSLLLAKGLVDALNGSFKWAEFVRDTSGQAPKKEVEVSADIITDSDKALLDKLTGLDADS